MPDEGQQAEALPQEQTGSPGEPVADVELEAEAQVEAEVEGGVEVEAGTEPETAVDVKGRGAVSEDHEPEKPGRPQEAGVDIATTLRAGRSALLRGDYAAARPHWEQALASARDAGDELVQADSILGLGMLALFRGSYEDAEVRYQQALAIAQRLGDGARQADVLEQLGLLHTMRGRPGLALAYYQQAGEAREA